MFNREGPVNKSSTSKLLCWSSLLRFEPILVVIKSRLTFELEEIISKYCSRPTRQHLYHLWRQHVADGVVMTLTGKWKDRMSLHAENVCKYDFRGNEWMNENLYIAHKQLPHKILRVHSARYTQCIHVSSRKLKLPKDMHSYQKVQTAPTHPPLSKSGTIHNS